MFRPIFIPRTKEIVWTYDQYLQTRHWKMVQYEFALLVPRICAICGSAKRLNIHHKTYKHIGNELITDLVYLCEDCHKHWHSYLNYQKYLYQRFCRMLRYYRNSRY